jgi:hypothetical protein
MILTAGCFFVYFLTFKNYAVSAKQLFQNDNNYFPSADGLTDFIDMNGKPISPDTQNNILYVVQGNYRLSIHFSLLMPSRYTLPLSLLLANNCESHLGSLNVTAA